MTQYWPEYSYYRTNRTCHQDVYRRLLAMRKTLSELKQRGSKETSLNKEFLDEEIKKAQDEISQACHEKLNVLEEKLSIKEKELARALKENERLKDQLELRNTVVSNCRCNGVNGAQDNDFTHMNGKSEEKPNSSKSNGSTGDFWQEWDRLHSDLMQAENKADNLNLLLNRKLIELNKMQLTLSKQTTEMVLLERAYFELRGHLMKRKTSSNKSRAGSRLSCSSARESPTIEQNFTEDSSEVQNHPEIPDTLCTKDS